MSKVKIKLAGIFTFSAALIFMVAYANYVGKYSGKAVGIYPVISPNDRSVPYGGSEINGSISHRVSPIRVSLDPAMNPLRLVLDVERAASSGRKDFLYEMHLTDGSGAEAWGVRGRYENPTSKTGGSRRAVIPLETFEITEPGEYILIVYLRKAGLLPLRVNEAEVTVRRNVAISSPAVYAAAGVAALVGFMLMMLSRRKGRIKPRA
ncbi:MAG: hypothetical protein RQ748_00885 [Elusimicrobiales bacterium]|nr:hypothetical protein [Elusimicrobiales bacterium]